MQYALLHEANTVSFLYEDTRHKDDATGDQALHSDFSGPSEYNLMEGQISS